MKKLIFFIFILKSNIFACGCVDSILASQGANVINQTYIGLDKTLESLFKKQLSYLDEIKFNELENQTITNNLINLKIDSIVTLDEYSFELLKRKNILSVNNHNENK